MANHRLSIVPRTLAAPTGQQSNAVVSVGDVAGLVAMVIGIPAAVVAVIMLANHVKQQRLTRRGKSDDPFIMTATPLLGRLSIVQLCSVSGGEWRRKKRPT